MQQYDKDIEHRFHAYNHTVTSITDQSFATRHHRIQMESRDVLGLWVQSCVRSSCSIMVSLNPGLLHCYTVGDNTKRGSLVT